METSTAQYLGQRPARQHEVRWNHPGWFIMRALRRSLAQRLGRLHAGARVLDFGCATAPYRGLLPDGVEYVGADLPGNAAAALHVSATGALPVAERSFDCVLSTQVLEHVADPAAYLRECLRVLKPGGELILTTHGLWIYHRDPVDYWRWTSEGLRFAATQQGFEVREMEGLMGLSAVAVQLFQDATCHHLPRFLRMPYAFVLQRLAALFDAFHSPASRVANAMVYVLAARRPG